MEASRCTHQFQGLVRLIAGDFPGPRGPQKPTSVQQAHTTSCVGRKKPQDPQVISILDTPQVLGIHGAGMQLASLVGRSILEDGNSQWAEATLKNVVHVQRVGLLLLIFFLLLAFLNRQQKSIEVRTSLPCVLQVGTRTEMSRISSPLQLKRHLVKPAKEGNPGLMKGRIGLLLEADLPFLEELAAGLARGFREWAVEDGLVWIVHHGVRS